MDRDEARIRVHKAIAAAGHVDRVDSILADLLVEVRAEALEEAAKICDERGTWTNGTPRGCASEIRRLAGQP